MERKKIRAPLGIQIRQVDHEKRTIRFTASDESVDRYGTIISAKGWNLQAYRKNPIFLFGHDYRSPWAVMGRAVKIEKDPDKGELVMDMLFMEKDLNPIAEMVYQMYAHRPPFLNAVSVGFIPLKIEEVKDTDQEKSKQSGVKRKAQYRFLEQELLELSAVTVPANPNAIGKTMGGSNWKLALEYLQELKGNGLDPVQLMAAKTVLGDDAERSQLQERMECWMEQQGLMVPCACNVREMIEVSSAVQDTDSWVSPILRTVAPVEQRTGAVLNAKNKGALSQAQTSMQDAVRLVQDVLDSATDDEGASKAVTPVEKPITYTMTTTDATADLVRRMGVIETDLQHVRGVIEDVYELLRRSENADADVDADVDADADENADTETQQESLKNLDLILNQVSSIAATPDPATDVAVAKLTKAMDAAGAKLAHFKL